MPLGIPAQIDFQGKVPPDLGFAAPPILAALTDQVDLDIDMDGSAGWLGFWRRTKGYDPIIVNPHGLSLLGELGADGQRVGRRDLRTVPQDAI